MQLKHILGAALLALLATPTSAQTITTHADCLLPDGQRGQMITRTYVYSQGELVYPGGRRASELPKYQTAGEASYWHEGLFIRPDGQYRFDGHNFVINFGHRGPVLRMKQVSQTRYVMTDAYETEPGVVVCDITSMQQEPGT